MREILTLDRSHEASLWAPRSEEQPGRLAPAGPGLEDYNVIFIGSG